MTDTAIQAPTVTRDLTALPKAHLHLHLEAAMRPATLIELCTEMGIEPPEISGFTEFTGFGQAYMRLLTVLSVPANLRRLIEEAVEDAARDGVVYVEFGVSPVFYAESFGSAEAALEAMTEQGEESGRRHGVAVGLMVTVDRTTGYEPSIEAAKLAARYAGRGVVGLGLANEERGYPAEDFADAFAIAKEAGLLSTPHAGELVGPESVWNALRVLQADRIQHGVRALEDPALIQELVESQVCLDVCPTSNVLLAVVPEITAHPLPALLAAGVRCSINADDPILFGPGVLEEYEVCRSALGLTDEQLAGCALASIESSGAPDAVKESAREGIRAWLAGEEPAGDREGRR
ncbi:adenosine deaminase [Naasia sp. SYSU D00948]|uniref:adenosine deaminase n=1 Tax=Naasia sp. SYSU D00948 TaxID=2817379 RepID=UPI001B3149E8|nr:adenosine deaminase [Naasia sp. SYSU D00948]